MGGAAIKQRVSDILRAAQVVSGKQQRGLGSLKLSSPSDSLWFSFILKKEEEKGGKEKNGTKTSTDVHL